MPLRVALIGMPGSGKTSVARQLARRLKLDMVDTDALIEARQGCAIKDIFAQCGEEAFRDLEQAVLEEVTQRDASVVSTGGGCVLRVENRRVLRDRCHVFYLRSSPDELYRRLRHDRHRPLLQGGHALTRLREMYMVRDPLYRQVAHYVVETGRPSVSALATTVISQLELAGLWPVLPGEEACPSR